MALLERAKKRLNYLIPDDEPGWCLVVPVELPGNPGRKADGLGVIINAYRKERKKIEGQLVPLLKKE